MCTQYTPKEPIGGWQEKGRGVEFEQFEHHHTSMTFWTKPFWKGSHVVWDILELRIVIT